MPLANAAARPNQGPAASAAAPASSSASASAAATVSASALTPTPGALASRRRPADGAGLDRGGPEKRTCRDTNILGLPPWLAAPARDVAHAVDPIRLFYDSNGNTKRDWDGWIQQFLAPELWRPGGMWTCLPESCIEARMRLESRDVPFGESSVVAALTRLVLCNALAVLENVVDITFLTKEQQATVRPTARVHADPESSKNKVTLGLLISLAFELHAFADSHRVLTVPKERFPGAPQAGHDPAPVNLVVERIVRESQHCKFQPTETAQRLCNILEALNRSTTGTVRLDLAHGPLPGIQGVPEHWAHAIRRFCCGLPWLKTVDPFGIDNWLQLVFHNKYAERWAEFAAVINASATELFNNFGIRDALTETIAFACEATVRFLLYSVNLHSSGPRFLPADIDVCAKRQVCVLPHCLTLRRLVDTAVGMSLFKTYFVMTDFVFQDGPWNMYRLITEHPSILDSVTRIGYVFFTGLVKQLQETSKITMNSKVVPDARWRARSVQASLAHASVPLTTRDGFSRQVRAIDAAFRCAHSLGERPIDFESVFSGVYNDTCLLSELGSRGSAVLQACKTFHWDPTLAVAILDSAILFNPATRARFLNRLAGYPLHYYRKMETQALVDEAFGCRGKNMVRSIMAQVDDILYDKDSCPQWNVHEYSERGVGIIREAALRGNPAAMELYGNMIGRPSIFCFLEDLGFCSYDGIESMNMLAGGARGGSSAALISIRESLCDRERRLPAAAIEVGFNCVRELAKEEGYAAFELGVLYRHGAQGVPLDHEAALEAFKTVLKLENSPSSTRCVAAGYLGAMYERGLGCAMSDKQAEVYFRQATGAGATDGERWARAKLADILQRERFPDCSARVEEAKSEYRIHFEMKRSEDRTFVSVNDKERGQWVTYEMQIKEDMEDPFISALGFLEPGILGVFGIVETGWLLNERALREELTDLVTAAEGGSSAVAMEGLMAMMTSSHNAMIRLPDDVVAEGMRSLERMSKMGSVDSSRFEFLERHICELGYSRELP